MAFDEMEFAKKRQPYLDRLNRAIQDLYKFEHGNPDFGGKMDLSHDTKNANTNDCSWKLKLWK